jgi:putative heme iron utilization protein
MDEPTIAAIADLVRSRTAGALGTLHDGAPFVSMVPVAILPDGAGLVVHVSGLAGHTRDMRNDARVSVLLMQAEGEGTPAQALARLTVQGEARELAVGTPGHTTARDAYLARFPDAAPLFGFGDFALFAVEPAFGRFVGGFAQAHHVRREALQQAFAAAAQD